MAKPAVSGKPKHGQHWPRQLLSLVANGGKRQFHNWRSWEISAQHGPHPHSAEASLFKAISHQQHVEGLQGFAFWVTGRQIWSTPSQLKFLSNTETSLNVSHWAGLNCHLCLFNEQRSKELRWQSLEDRHTSYISSALEKNPIINFHPVKRTLCNSIPHKVNTTFHLISSVSRMSLTFFRPQLITVIHSLVLQLWFFFFPATNHCKCNASRSLRSSSQTPAFKMCQNCLGKFPSTVLEHLPVLYQGVAAPPSLVFPESAIPCQIKHRQQAQLGTWDACLKS